jgi:hypothetical protein
MVDKHCATCVHWDQSKARLGKVEGYCPVHDLTGFLMHGCEEWDRNPNVYGCQRCGVRIFHYGFCHQCKED